jgi:hypothetical protein
MIASRRVLVASTVLAVVASLLPLPALVSACIILAFLAIVPGTVCCGLLGFDVSGAFGWTIVLGTSFGIDTLINEALLYTHVWTPTRALLNTAALVVVGIAVQSRMDRAPDLQAFGGPSAR